MFYGVPLSDAEQPDSPLKKKQLRGQNLNLPSCAVRAHALGSSGYRIDFESWGSEIGVPPSSATDHVLFLTGPPWNGILALLAAADGKSLTLNAGQHTYVFARMSVSSS